MGASCNACGNTRVVPGTEKDRCLYCCVECACGRGNPQIGDKNLEHLGWRMIDGKWCCPFCTGNTANLRALFDSAAPAANADASESWKGD